MTATQTPNSELVHNPLKTLQTPNMGSAQKVISANQHSLHNPLGGSEIGDSSQTFQTPNMALGQKAIRTNLSSLNNSLGFAQILSVTAGYSQKKKDSVQAVLIQRYADCISLRGSVTSYPDYIGLASRRPNTIGSVQRFPDDIGLAPAILTAGVCTKPTILAQSGCSHMTIPSAGGRDLNHVNDVREVQPFPLVSLRVISSRIAAIMNWASLSPSYFTFSMASNTSNGTLAVFCRDLLLSVPVAIICSSILKWESLYLFSENKKHLKCKSPNSKVQVTLISSSSKPTKPRQCSNTSRASNHNVKRSNTMAMYKSTQTHPKFKWRFFSCQQSTYFTVEARSEQEARSMLPDAPCLFSARIRQGVNHG